ncbi:hypothetical protein HPG69_014180 [Diceros bicornis minor]|uniref:Interleukin-5 receptor subunit alpha n=1 Tax=Diceros bicornis minor TaxID=77932 RepID=A0A7J7EZ52_DICBM|nr:hypothetical protein HPG69_014180 [Diceros bicornis minor]
MLVQMNSVVKAFTYEGRMKDLEAIKLTAKRTRGGLISELKFCHPGECDFGEHHEEAVLINKGSYTHEDGYDHHGTRITDSFGGHSDTTVVLLPPVNFTIKVTGLAQVLLRWEPNPDQEQRNVKLGYRVKINAPQEEDYETRNTESKRVTILHKGFSASVQTIPWSDPSPAASSWVSADLKAPPGSPGTSIVNLTCITNTAANNYTHLRPYQVSLHCTWLVGKDAPEDTQYFLYYRYGSWTEECQEYGKDTLKRNIACWFPRTFINSKGRDSLAVHVNGSSQHAVIKPFDQLFALHAIDRVNPPVNITVEIEGTSLSIQWEKPVSAFPVHCFDYEVKIYNTRKGYFQTEKMTANAFISVIDDISKYSIQVRAAVRSVCRAMGPWSEWSQPIYVGYWVGLQEIPRQ